MIIYIHGFSGSGDGIKANAFREYFKSLDEGFVAPSLSYIPELAIQTLEELIESYKGNVKLIGSSLGGFYTIYLAQKYGLRGVLINPSIFPYETLAKLTGYVPSYYDESIFEWRESHIKMLKNYEKDEINQSDFMLLVQKGDETLDYKKAVNKFANANVIIEEGGTHGFDGIERHFERIREFIL
ncbi:esterase [Candidatus Sulfurimonas marisnigri]|uniref:Esterase n=1 Tax=Candidatus Sulfurimonas marisnigri TaxID=2740405 RepID=A0A7S7RQA4_9BACT|nr:YqiA/YcfP family alpha/beta fold hydrolase [Candidatus Sulfurimonas marisnigri]QOY54255.1 esterase [Candidatus Sulfurimonas marisnigri]